jgi:hypothetical protein
MDSTNLLYPLLMLVLGAIGYRFYTDRKSTQISEREKILKDEYTSKEKTLEHIHKELTGVELEEKKKTEAEVLDFWNGKKK